LEQSEVTGDEGEIIDRGLSGRHRFTLEPVKSRGFLAVESETKRKGSLSIQIDKQQGALFGGKASTEVECRRAFGRPTFEVENRNF
jgi:hypothetical protein